MFFRASSDRVPDAIPSHLLKDARYTSLDADQLEIGLAPIEPLPGGGTKVWLMSLKTRDFLDLRKELPLVV
jgi:hypothetical protein